MVGRARGWLLLQEVGEELGVTKGLSWIKGVTVTGSKGEYGGRWTRLGTGDGAVWREPVLADKTGTGKRFPWPEVLASPRPMISSLQWRAAE